MKIGHICSLSGKCIQVSPFHVLLEIVLHTINDMEAEILIMVNDGRTCDVYPMCGIANVLDNNVNGLCMAVLFNIHFGMVSLGLSRCD